jgi:RHS repeat-associated protein
MVPLALALIAVALGEAAAGSVRAAAGKPDGTCGFCVLAPSGQSLRLTGKGSVSLSKANVIVNSNGNPAVSLNGNASLVAPSVGVVGTVAGGNGMVQNLTTGITPIADPLAGLETPSLPLPKPVPSVNLSGNDSRQISPGVFDEISVTGKGNLTLQPGTYVVRRQFTATGNASITAEGVTIYLACSAYPAPCNGGEQGAPLTLTGKGSLNLSGPTVKCSPVAIFADRSSTGEITLTGNGGLPINGMIYSKSGTLGLTGNGAIGVNGLVVVGNATLTGNGNVSIANSVPLSAGLGLSLAASSTSQRLGETETLTATLTCHGKPLTEQPVTFTVTGTNPNHGASKTDAAGKATFSYEGRALGADTAQAVFAAPGIGISSAPVTVNWSKALPSISTSVPEGSVEQGKAISDTSTVSGGFSPTGTVSWNVYASADTTCKTPLNSERLTASLSNGMAQAPGFTPTEAGTYQFVATYEGDANNEHVSTQCGDQTEQVLVTEAAAGINPVATTTVEGNFYAAEPSATTFTAKPGDKPAFAQSFPTINFNPPNPLLTGHGLRGEELPIGTVPGNISGVGPQTRPFTDITTDLAGNFSGTVVAKGNGLQAGVGSLTGFDAALTAKFIVSKAGDVTFNIVHDDGFLLGIGGGATRVSGAYENPPEPAQTVFKQYPLIGAFDRTTGESPGTDHVTVHFPKAGTYAYELDYFESGSATQLSLTMTVGSVSQTTCKVCLYVGYADGLRPAGSIFPFPWQGSPGVTFIGSGPFDSGALRFVNTTDTSSTLESVVVDIGGNHFDIWPRNMVVPAHQELMLAQTTTYNFDTSDYSGNPCGANGGVKPIITVLSGGQKSVFTDTNEVLNTKDYDLACQGNESTSWELVGGTGSPPAPECSAVEKTLWIGNDEGGDTFQTDLSGHVLADIRGLGTTGFAYAGSALFFGKRSGEVQERTPNGQEVIRTFSLPPDNPSEDMAWDCKRHKIWRIGHDNKLREFDPTTGAEEKTFSLPTTDPTGELTPLGGLGVAYDGKRDVLYVSFCQQGCTGLEAGLVEIVDPETGAVKGTLFRAAGFKTGGLAYEPDDDTLWVGSNALVRHITLSGEVLSSFARPQPGGFVDGLEFSPTPATKPPSGVNAPLPPADSLTLSPAEHTTRNVGEELTFTASLMDAKGHAVVNVPVSLTLRGANPQTLSSATDAAGIAKFAPVVGKIGGEDTAQAVAFVEGRQSVSSTTSVTWNILKPGTTEPGGTAEQAPPAITAITPKDGTELSKPVPVTAAIAPPEKETITSWKVTARALGPEPVITLASGAGTPPSPLATFDPTKVPDGTYAITVSATASGGGTQTATSTVVVKGNLKLGRYVTTYQDLSVPANGFQMQVRRVYDSIDKRVGDFGIGWHVEVSNFRVSANRELGAGGWNEYPTSCFLGLVCRDGFTTSVPHFVTVTFPGGHQEVFDFTPGEGVSILGFAQGKAKFSARAGTGATSALEVAENPEFSYGFDGNLYNGVGLFAGTEGIYNPTRFKLTTHDGRVLVLDVNSGLVSETDRNGNSLAVDSGGVHSTIGPAPGTAGPSITFKRDSQGRIEDVTGPVSGQHLHYSYEGAELHAVTDANSNTDTYEYDPATGNLASVKGPPPANQPLQTLRYDASGRLESVASGTEPPTHIETNVAGRTQSFLDPNGKLTTTLTYDELGDVLQRSQVFNGKTLTTKYTYDAVGRPETVTDAVGDKTAIEYDESNGPSNGEVLSVSSAGRTWRFGNYNAFGEPGQITKPDNTIQSTITYDATTGAVQSIARPGQPQTEFSRYPSGALKSVTDPGGRSVAYQYDTNGNLSAVSDGAGHATSLEIDAAGQLRSITDRAGNRASFERYPDGSLKTLTDGNGHEWHYTYDALGRLHQVRDPLEHVETYEYNDVGLLSKLTNGDEKITTYSYDADGLLSKEVRPGNEVVNYTYDPLGRLVEADNSAAHADRSYDDASRLASETTCANTGSPTTPCSSAATGLPFVSTSYAYHADSQLASVRSSDTNIPEVAYGYDNLGRLATVQYGSQTPFVLSYDSLDRLQSLSRPNGISDAFSYNNSEDLTGRDATLHGSTVARFDYGIDPITGRRTSMTDSSGTTAYTYYDSGALKSVTPPAGSPLPSESYTYDKAGNRSGASATWHYDSANRLLSDGIFNYEYDNAGDLTARTPIAGGSGTTYAWNADHELTGITYPDRTTSGYSYDPFGRRVVAIDRGKEARFTYDGTSPKADYNGSNQLQTSYLSGLETMTAGGQPTFYLSDGLASIRALTDASGKVTGTYSYSAFGLPATGNAQPSRETFTGYQFDAASGLYDAGARYYDPATGRFLSRDPVASVNRYPYAAGDPVDLVDKYGLQAAAEYATLAQANLNNAQCVAGFVDAIAGPTLAAVGLGLSGFAVPAEKVTKAINTALVANDFSCLGNAGVNLAPKGAQAAAAIISDLLTQGACKAAGGEKVNVAHALLAGAFTALMGRIPDSYAFLGPLSSGGLGAYGGATGNGVFFGPPDIVQPSTACPSENDIRKSLGSAGGG